MLDALDALQGAGHTRIGFIGGIGAIMGLHNQPEDIRTLAFTDWSRRLHADRDESVVVVGGVDQFVDRCEERERGPLLFCGGAQFLAQEPASASG